MLHHKLTGCHPMCKTEIVPEPALLLKACQNFQHCMLCNYHVSNAINPPPIRLVNFQSITNLASKDAFSCASRNTAFKFRSSGYIQSHRPRKPGRTHVRYTLSGCSGEWNNCCKSARNISKVSSKLKMRGWRWPLWSIVSAKVRWR